MQMEPCTYGVMISTGRHWMGGKDSCMLRKMGKSIHNAVKGTYNRLLFSDGRRKTSS